MMNLRRAVIYLLCAALIFGVFAAPVQAKTSRTAVITEVVGVVEVTKSGGSKSYRAFAGMTLNQGDQIETGEGAKAVLQLADTNDEITIGQNSRLYISELLEQDGGKKSKLKTFAGSLWSKVRTLVGAEDEFEVETPTATMGVRGTHFFVGIHAETGDPVFFTGSGLVAVKPVGSDDEILTFPGESATFFGNQAVASAVDLSEVFVLADVHTLEAMVRSAGEISEENRQLLLQEIPQLEQKTISELEALANYMGLVTEYVELVINVLSGEADPAQLIEQLPQLQFANEADAEKERQRREQLEQLKQRREAELQEKENRRQEIQQNNQELVSKIQDQRQQQEEANKAASEEEKQRAKERYLSNLSEEQKQQFEQEAAKREEERQQAEQKAEESKAPLPPVPEQPPAGGQAPAGGSGDGGSGDSGGGGDTSPPPSALPAFSLNVVDISVEENDYIEETFVIVDFSVGIRNVSGLYAAEAHFLTDNLYELGSPTSQIFNPNDSEYTIRMVPVDAGGREANEVIYAALKVPPAGAVNVTQGTLATFTLMWRFDYADWFDPDLDKITIDLIKLLLTDAEGNVILTSTGTTTIEIPLEEHKSEGGGTL